MTKREILQCLIREIRLDIEDYQQLKSLLSHQRDLLERRDQQALNLHNPRQDDLCGKLKTRSERRSLALEKLGFNADNQGMNKLINALPADAKQQMSNLWKNLQRHVLICQQENDRNGKLLAQQKETLDKVLDPSKSDNYDYCPA